MQFLYYLKIYYISIIFMKKRGRKPLPVRLPGQRGRLPGQKPKDHGLTFKRGIHAVSLTMEGRRRIKKTAMGLLDGFMVEIFKAIAREAGNLCEHSKSKVLGAKSVESACKILLPGEMAQYAIEEAQAATLRFSQYEKPRPSMPGTP